MRQMLFRGWDQEKWMYAEVVEYDAHVETYYMPFSETNWESHHEDEDWIPVSGVGQYIGLSDQIGCKMFEGDKVTAYDVRHDMTFTGYIEFHNGSYCINNDDTSYHYRLMDYQLEVIGSAYEEYADKYL